MLLDLLRVVSVHGGRLATPIRSMQRHVEEADPRPVRYDASDQGQPILVNAVASRPGNNEDHKPGSRKQQGQVETQSVTVIDDTKDGSDSLSKWKAIKNISTQVSTSKAAVDSPSDVKEPHDVKEADNRRLESKS